MRLIHRTHNSDYPKIYLPSVRIPDSLSAFPISELWIYLDYVYPDTFLILNLREWYSKVPVISPTIMEETGSHFGLASTDLLEKIDRLFVYNIGEYVNLF